MLTFFSNGISNATLSGRSEGNVRLQSSKSSARALSLFCCLTSGGVDIAKEYSNKICARNKSRSILFQLSFSRCELREENNILPTPHPHPYLALLFNLCYSLISSPTCDCQDGLTKFVVWATVSCMVDLMPPILYNPFVFPYCLENDYYPIQENLSSSYIANKTHIHHIERYPIDSTLSN